MRRIMIAILVLMLCSPCLVQAQEISEPFVPDNLEKKIIGTDDRITISNPAAYPYSAIAFLDIEMECGCSGQGSGFMVSPNGMMTAAHCVVCTEHGAYMKNLTIYFGYKSPKNYLYKYTGGYTCWYGASPLEDPRGDMDYAYLMLDQDVGNKTGWFGLMSCSDDIIRGANMELAGYRDGLLKTHEGAVDVRDMYSIYYQTDSVPGNSGCPVFDEQYYVVAVHVASSIADVNIGRRITDDLMREMRENNVIN